jgi:hypothetical protein
MGPMRLLRFAILTLGGDAGEWAALSTEYSGCIVRALHHQPAGDGSRILLVAEAPLLTRPTTSEGLLSVPEGPRRAAEQALEVAANLVSVATGHGRQIGTPGFAVGFRAEDEAERAWLHEQSGIADADKGIAFGRLTVTVGEAELAALSDREDGLEYLSEALGHEHRLGRYPALLRVFEAAFLTDEPANPLGRFLMSRPGLQYTKGEVDSRLKVRGRAVHADRLDRDILVEKGVRAFMDRMLLAAYELLFNKLHWHQPDSARRDVWTLQVGPLDPNGRWFVVTGSERPPCLNAQFLDRFRAFPMDLVGAQFELESDCWPQRGPVETTLTQPPVESIPAERLAPVL